MFKRLLGVASAVIALLTGCGGLGAKTDRSVTSQPVFDEQVTVLVAGWRRNELEKILSDFEGKYEGSTPALEVTNAPDKTFRIRLRHPLAAEQVLYLVNYVHYPEGFELRGRSIAVVAAVKLNEAFGVAGSPMEGQVAAFYVPENDTSYTEVYAKLPDGTSYRLPFTDLVWRRVHDGRRPRAVDRLLDLVKPVEVAS